MSGSAAAKPSPSKTATAPRKRRKRTTTGGAPDDCFACAQNGLKCDRRRPYCSPCLDRGKDCSGYKTTLTWGVGVASRGKLRGRALPVSDGQSAPSSPKERRHSAFKTSPRPSHRRDSTVKAAPVVPSSVPETEPTTLYDTQHWPATSVQQPGPQNDAHSMLPSHDHVFGLNGPSAILQRPVDAHPQEIRHYSFDIHTTSSGISESTQESWAQPVSVPHTAAYTAYADYGHSVPFQWPAPTTGKRSVSFDDDLEIDEAYMASLASETNQPPTTIYAPDQNKIQIQNQHTWVISQSPFANSLPDLLLEQSVGRNPRIRYLISYFAEVIAPVIVAFDSPSNPYRTRILQLAHHSDTLQHAIAALSASNIRQRREEKIHSTERTEPSRMSSMAHRALTDASFQARHGIQGIGGSYNEEIFHKSVAIKSLNEQLADPSRRHHDSVLATLLVLCLFHICETGVAQFQTQFAGVRKLLSMRRRTNALESEEARWCTRMFTWFDAMTATINNREGQLQGPLLDMTCLSDEEWAMENLAGCDGRLFKVLARLGRLNVLAQNKPVDPSYNIDMPAAMPVLPPSVSHYTPNGMNVAYATNLYSNPPVEVGNAEFWTEWHSIRQQLEGWRLDSVSLAGGHDLSTLSPPYSCGSLSSSPSSAPTFASVPMSPGSKCLVAPKNMTDLSNISEAFRYSALLYTERLAYPGLPSTHPRIQTFVLTAMHYIAAVRSDVYLLWPLFVTGSECVYAEHRAAIRDRCRDIQKDSGFYNNISCLELLEKIWARNPVVQTQDQVIYNNFNGMPGNPVSNVRTQVPQKANRHNHGFKWQSIVDEEGLDGEYIVI